MRGGRGEKGMLGIGTGAVVKYSLKKLCLD